MNTTDCTTMEQIAALVEGHDGKTTSLLRLIGTNFVVSLGRAGHWVRVMDVPDVISTASRFLAEQRRDERCTPETVRNARVRLLGWIATPVYLERSQYLTGTYVLDAEGPEAQQERFEAWALCLSCGLKIPAPDQWSIREEQRIPSGRRAQGVPTLATERSRVAKDLRKLPRPKPVKRSAR